MLALGIETAGEMAGIALVDDAGVVAEHSFRHQHDLTCRLMPNIAKLTEDAGCPRESIDLIAVSIGPGSFTGLRIGVATAKTLAQGLGCGIAGISTLEALARGALGSNDGLVCATIRARKDEYFAGLYQQNEGQFITLFTDTTFSFQDLVKSLSEQNAPVLVCGEVINSKRSDLQSLPGSKIRIAEPWQAIPRAAAIASMGLLRQQAGTLDDLMALAPKYTRLSQAEVRLAQGRLAWDKK